MTYLKQLTSIRGVVALYVLLFHFQLYFHLNSEALDFLLPFINKGYLGVDYFFLLSGFIMAHVYGDAFNTTRFKKTDTLHPPDKQLPRTPTNNKPLNLSARYLNFITARIARIYPLHVALLILLVSIEGVKLLLGSETAFTGQQEPIAIISNLLLIQAWNVHNNYTWNQPAWSISAEWLAYLLFPLLLLLRKIPEPIIKFSISLLLLISIHTLVLLSPHNSMLDLTYHNGLYRVLTEFSLGLLLYDFFQSIKDKPFTAQWSKPALSMLVILIFGGLFFNFPDSMIITLMAFSIPVLAVSDGFLVHFLHSGPLYWLGEISYSIYLTHLVILERLIQGFFKFSPLNPASLDTTPWLIMLAFTLAICLSFSHFTYKFVEVPLRYYLRNHLQINKLPFRSFWKELKYPAIPPSI